MCSTAWHRVWVSVNNPGFLLRKPVWNVWGRKLDWVLLFLFFLICGVRLMMQIKANSTKGHEWDLANRELKQNVTSALLMSFSRWEAPDERHSQAMTNTLLLTYHLGRANPVCEPCKANLCQCSCCTEGSTFACAPWSVSLGSWGWDALEFTPRQLKLACPSRKVSGEAVGGCENWILSTPSLCREAAQGITVALDHTSWNFSGISLSQSLSRWKGSGVRMKRVCLQRKQLLVRTPAFDGQFFPKTWLLRVFHSR